MVEVSRRTEVGIRRRGHLLGKVWKFSRWDMWWRVDEHAILTAWKSLASSSKWMHKRWLMHFHLLPHNVSFNLWTQQCFRTDACPQTNKGSVCAQSCPTLCDLRDCSPPGSSVHGILQARILERVAMPSSRASSPPRDGTHVSYVS